MTEDLYSEKPGLVEELKALIIKSLKLEEVLPGDVDPVVLPDGTLPDIE